MKRARHYSNRVSSFPDPLNMGHRYSLLLAVAAELVGGILITIGLAGRVAALLLAFSLGMAVFTGEAGGGLVAAARGRNPLPGRNLGYSNVGMRPLGARRRGVEPFPKRWQRRWLYSAQAQAIACGRRQTVSAPAHDVGRFGAPAISLFGQGPGGESSGLVEAAGCLSLTDRPDRCSEVRAGREIAALVST